MGSEQIDFFKWNQCRTRNLIPQLITSNIWKERNYCISALHHLRWAPGIMHIRKWNMCKSLKMRSWPKVHFKAFNEQERSQWELGRKKKAVQLLKNGKCLFYIQKVNCVLRQKRFGLFERQAHLCIRDFKNFSRNKIVLLVKFWLLKNLHFRWPDNLFFSYLKLQINTGCMSACICSCFSSGSTGFWAWFRGVVWLMLILPLVIWISVQRLVYFFPKSEECLDLFACWLSVGDRILGVS